MKYTISSTWDGAALRPREWVDINIEPASDLMVSVDSPFFNDPPPPGPTGAFDGLWAYEVVEIFLLGENDRYLEVELGPLGHHLVLRLEGQRHVVEKELPITYTSSVLGDRWSGKARIPGHYLPTSVTRGNAYAIHGTGALRTHLALYPLGGRTPDFHRLEDFGPITVG